MSKRKENFKFFPRGLAGNQSVYSRPQCEFNNCGKPSDFIAEGDKGNVLYACDKHESQYKARGE